MNEEKKCKYCQSPLDVDIHGNSDYCNEDCSYEMKLQRNKDKYQNDKKLKESFVKSDKILEMFYHTYGADQFIPAILLDNAGMDWLISKGEASHQGLSLTVIDTYGYCLFKNETVKICKISHQQQ